MPLTNSAVRPASSPIRISCEVVLLSERLTTTRYPRTTSSKRHAMCSGLCASSYEQRCPAHITSATRPHKSVALGGARSRRARDRPGSDLLLCQSTIDDHDQHRGNANGKSRRRGQHGFARSTADVGAADTPSFGDPGAQRDAAAIAECYTC